MFFCFHCIFLLCCLKNHGLVKQKKGSLLVWLFIFHYCFYFVFLVSFYLLSFFGYVPLAAAPHSMLNEQLKQTESSQKISKVRSFCIAKATQNTPHGCSQNPPVGKALGKRPKKAKKLDKSPTRVTWCTTRKRKKRSSPNKTSIIFRKSPQKKTSNFQILLK